MHDKQTAARPGDEAVLEITDLAFGGRGVARLSGKVVFVEGALPGESVRARVHTVRSGFVEAKTIEILRRSPTREEPPCRHYGECGGCDLQHLSRSAQARAKGEQVRALLRRVGRIADPPVADTVVPGRSLAYRFRMDFDWQGGRRGQLVLGLHRRGRPDDIVSIRRCELTSDIVNRIVVWLAREAAARRLDAPDRRRRTGLLWRTTIQEAHGTGEILVVLETGRGDPPALTQLARDLLRRFQPVVGVVRCLSDRRGRKENSVLAGRDYLEEVIEDDRFRVPAGAFFQPNPSGSAALRREVIAATEPREDHAILELYCGVGFFSIPMARRARRVLGVEGSRPACAAARYNAAAAGVVNCSFLEGEVAAALPDLLVEGWDTLLLDPPRVGLPRPAVEALVAARAPRLVYVSCNPATLARDVSILTGKGGYSLDAVTPIDLFPQTHHIECVARMSHSRARG